MAGQRLPYPPVGGSNTSDGWNAGVPLGLGTKGGGIPVSGGVNGNQGGNLDADGALTSGGSFERSWSHEEKDGVAKATF